MRTLLLPLGVLISSDHVAWTSFYYGPAVGRPTSLRLGLRGRYVRIQLRGSDPLSLSEVQVFGTLDNRHLVTTAGQRVLQSSTLTYVLTGTPDHALDGNVSGNWWDNTVTQTNNDAQAWWALDFATAQMVGAVEVWNRTDDAVDRLQNFDVKVSMDSSNGVDGTWTSFPVTGVAGRPTLVSNINRYARWVKVQLRGTNYLTLAEVRVWSN